MKFRLKPNVGVHVGAVEVDANGDELPAKVYGAGSVVESTKKLSDIWPEKWEEVHESTPAQGVVGKKPAESPATKPAATGPVAPNVTGPILGPGTGPTAPATPTAGPTPAADAVEDVTASFPLAVQHNLQVWGNEQSGYAVRELDVPNGKAVNAAPLSREAMEKFLEAYTAS